MTIAFFSSVRCITKNITKDFIKGKKYQPNTTLFFDIIYPSSDHWEQHHFDNQKLQNTFSTIAFFRCHCCCSWIIQILLDSLFRYYFRLFRIVIPSIIFLLQDIIRQTTILSSFRRFGIVFVVAITTSSTTTSAYHHPPGFLFDNKTYRQRSKQQQPLTISTTSTNHPFSSYRKDQLTIMKAWTCHGRSQRELVDRLMHAKIICSKEVQNVMMQVDRKYYANYEVLEMNYQDNPQPIGLGQTISAPHMHAHALEEILPYLVRNKYLQMQKQQQLNTTSTGTVPSATPTDTEAKPEQSAQPCLRVLDVGCGSGYLTACFGRLFRSKYDEMEASTSTSPTDTSSSSSETNNGVLGCPGTVYGIDIHQHLVELATNNIQQDDGDLFVSGTLRPLRVQNGWDGLIQHAPYDAIHVGAAAASFPHLLAQQLNIGGILIIPIGPLSGTQSLYKVVRITDVHNSIEQYTNSSISNMDEKKKIAYSLFEPNDYQLTELLGVRYVPLVNRPTTITSTPVTTTTSSSPPENKA